MKSWHQNSYGVTLPVGPVFFPRILWVLTFTAHFSLLHEMGSKKGKYVTSTPVESFIYIQFIMFHSIIMQH